MCKLWNFLKISFLICRNKLYNFFFFFLRNWNLMIFKWHISFALNRFQFLKKIFERSIRLKYVVTFGRYFCQYFICTQIWYVLMCEKNKTSPRDLSLKKNLATYQMYYFQEWTWIPTVNQQLSESQVGKG